MTGPVPLLLWAAALVCAILALRPLRAARRAPAAGPLPAWLRGAARVPVPRGLRRVAARPNPDRALRAAGLEPATYAPIVVGARAGAAGVALSLALAATLSTPRAMALAPVAALAAACAPDRWLRRTARRRRARVVRELPDLLDLLAISVAAGMALDHALRMAADRLGGVVGMEVGRTLRDLALGTPRRAAYRGLAARVAAPELTQVVAALLQAEELGAPLSSALGGQAEGLRAARGQQARDRAARAAPRIQLVVALVMVPGALLLVMGVMLIELARQVGAVTGAG